MKTTTLYGYFRASNGKIGLCADKREKTETGSRLVKREYKPASFATVKEAGARVAAMNRAAIWAEVAQ